MKFKIGDIARTIIDNKKIEITALGRTAETCFGKSLTNGKIFFYYLHELTYAEDPNDLLKKIL